MIGIFDSGIGGLTVVRELLKHQPEAAFIYLGDTARTPYGNKSPETVVRYALEDAAFLVQHGATSIVIACNTASAVASDELRRAYPNLPIYEVITPAAQDALAVTHGRIGIIGTRATINSKAYENILKSSSSFVIRHSKFEIYTQACPLFVPLVEEGWLKDSETKRIVRYCLAPLRQAHVDTLILGCTHYPLLAPLIQRFMGKRVKVIDSARSVVTRLLAAGPLKTGEQLYYLTDLLAHSEDIARKWLGRSVHFERVKF
jgi:glutamate racemase